MEVLGSMFLGAYPARVFAAAHRPRTGCAPRTSSGSVLSTTPSAPTATPYRAGRSDPITTIRPFVSQ
ncbi:hypothetical protein [Nocardia brevicatena]|uniref:hypothetical protein n=1 Tax=Nocardia brevicatena TaxID=37327 RepID=UPI0012FBF896|nr:hypothetical protein [Nocardia brevicatena]